MVAAYLGISEAGFYEVSVTKKIASGSGGNLLGVVCTCFRKTSAAGSGTI